jgi:hypothetical protein
LDWPYPPFPLRDPTDLSKWFSSPFLWGTWGWARRKGRKEILAQILSPSCTLLFSTQGCLGSPLLRGPYAVPPLHLLVFGVASCSKWSRQPGVQELAPLQTGLSSSRAPSESGDLKIVHQNKKG